ncbi:hypothetical protein F2P81_020947 [Scophthalmus maximus]|uniref:Uncharacterized protein n=1 Tax=Scophthalmus maximus TaxID=52904 RepID=A0A6A4S3I8_SCOMX|nr:hypothetical protein F2P81_020947 [Scophthalmus maximus]
MSVIVRVSCVTTARVVSGRPTGQLVPRSITDPSAEKLSLHVNPDGTRTPRDSFPPEVKQDLSSFMSSHRHPITATLTHVDETGQCFLQHTKSLPTRDVSTCCPLQVRVLSYDAATHKK